MKNLDSKIHYRGFSAGVSFDEDDELLYADCMVVGDMLVACGKNLAELHESFRTAVDAYMLRWGE